MNNTLFIQFTSDIKIKDGVYTAIGNGFADTYDLCKSKGDFYWVHHTNTNHIVLKNKLNTIEECNNNKLPFYQGTVYVCAVCITHLYQTYLWAKRYPNITFIVGGPVVISPIYTIVKRLPRNMKITTLTVEEYFKVKNFSGRWVYDVPEDKNPGRFIQYTIDTNCYWGKCIYCAGHNECIRRTRTKLDFEFDNIEYNKPTILRLNTPSITAKFMKQYFPILPRRDELTYSLLMRPSRYENKALLDMKDKCNDLKLFFGMGIEFPSNRMLNFVNRGMGNEETLETLHTINDNYKNSSIVLTSMLGWENLTDSDLKEAETFIKNLPSNARLIIFRLIARPNTMMHNEYKKDRDINIGPFYRGFVPKLTEEQNKMNERARSIFNMHKNVQDYYNI